MAKIIRRKEDRWRLVIEVIVVVIVVLLYMDLRRVSQENKVLTAENTLFREQVTLYGSRAGFWKDARDLNKSLEWSEWTARKMMWRFTKTAKEDDTEIKAE